MTNETHQEIAQWTPESLAEMLDEYGVVFTARQINAAIEKATEHLRQLLQLGQTTKPVPQPQRSEQECKCEPEHGFAWHPDCPAHQPPATDDRCVITG